MRFRSVPLVASVGLAFFALAADAFSGRAFAQRDQPTYHFPLVVHIPPNAAGAPLISDDGVERWLRGLNEAFSPAGVQFYVFETERLGPESTVLETIRERRRLSRRVVSHRINVFVHERIEDPTPSRSTRRAADRAGVTLSGRLGGAHIPHPRGRPGTYILTLAGDEPRYLIHEMGHFFGAPHHADPENYMSYGRDRQRFDARQLRVFRQRARRYRRSRAIRGVLWTAPSAPTTRATPQPSPDPSAPRAPTESTSNRSATPTRGWAGQLFEHARALLGFALPRVEIITPQLPPENGSLGSSGLP